MKQHGARVRATSSLATANLLASYGYKGCPACFQGCRASAKHLHMVVRIGNLVSQSTEQPCCLAITIDELAIGCCSLCSIVAGSLWMTVCTM